MRSIKIMLLGIALILVSLYVSHEFRTAGLESFVIGFGFTLVIVGFFKKDMKDH